MKLAQLNTDGSIFLSKINDLKKTGKWTNNNLQNITRNWLNYEYVLFLPQRFKVMDLGH
jgi:hypothetical protein